MFIHFESGGQVAEALSSATPSPNQTLWLLCVADAHGEQLPELIENCRTRGLRIAGGVFPGLIHGSEAKYQGIIAQPLPADSRVLLADLDEEGAHWREPLPQNNGQDYHSAVLFIDCLAKGVSSLLESLYDHFGGSLNYYGAGTGYHDLRTDPCVFDGERAMRGVALLVISPERATVSVRHGWKRVAGPFVASLTEHNVIKELNWEPAEALYRNQVGLQDPEYAQRPVFPDMGAIYPLCIAHEGCEDIIRDPIGVSPDGEITVLSDVAENSMMYLAHGDEQSLIEAAREAVEACGSSAGTRQCFVSDCFSRVLKLDDAFPRELQAVTRSLARICDLVPEGVLALGEIANSDGRYLELHNKTFVVALIHG